MKNSIAIAGLPGSGKSTLCNRLTSDLGWRIHTIGYLFRERYNEWKIKENKQNISFEDYWANVVTDDGIYEVNRIARNMLEQGNIILDSRYAAVNAFGLPSCLLVLVKAPLDIRAERNKNNPRYNGKSLEETKKILEDREKEEVRRGYELYSYIINGNYDYRNENLYHLVLDTSKLTVEEELDLVKEYLQR